MTFPPLPQPIKAGTRFIDPGGMQGQPTEGSVGVRALELDAMERSVVVVARSKEMMRAAAAAADDAAGRSRPMWEWRLH